MTEESGYEEEFRSQCTAHTHVSSKARELSRFLVQMMCKLYAVKIGQKQQRKVIIPHFSVGANLQSAMHSSLTVAAQVYSTWKPLNPSIIKGDVWKSILDDG